MKLLFNLTLSVVLLIVVIVACDSPTKIDEKKRVELSGKVLNKLTNLPLDDAFVKIKNNPDGLSTLTDLEGKYTLAFEADSEFTVTVVASKESYIADSANALAIPERSVNMPALMLMPTSSTPTTSGNASSIILRAQSTDHIAVRESGDPEVAQLVFEVQDSAGVPVDLDHSVEVSFIIGAGPGGGEFISPASDFTNNSGQVIAVLTSGIIAGTVQIIAQIQVDGHTIRSKPVAIAIHGGLPDQTHFSIAVEKLNFPGYNIFGLKDRITAFVGDKYSNPVRPNTSVYFSSDGGIIEGSSQTNEEGSCSVDLISAEPRPFHPSLGAGFATVIGSTIDENQNTITDDIIVLFSGIPTISVSPTSFDIPNLGYQSFIYRVYDQNSNPLSSGQSINVSVDGEGIEALGTTDATLPDTQSQGWTIFGFTIAETDSTVKPRPILIEITTSGPNGGAILGIGGTAR
jgi:hypothetical protein